MKNLLYIGNNLNSPKANTTGIQRLGKLLETEGYELRYASHYNNKMMRLIHMCWSILVKAKWSDLVLIDTYSTQNFWYVVFCSFLCRVLRIPYVPILHGGNLPNRLKSHPKLCSAIFNNSYKIVAPSMYLKHAFKNHGIENVNYIPNAVNIKNYSFGEKQYSSIKLFWLRSFARIYNPKMAVQVLQKLISLGYNAELCMVGPDVDGSAEFISDYAKSNNLNIVLPGKLSWRDWTNLSGNYNIFINTSNFDNMPVSVIEAMALGFPVISTNVGGMPYLIDNYKDGILVNEKDSDAMTKAVVKLFEDATLRQEIINNARLKAETFNWGQIKDKWKLILKPF